MEVKYQQQELAIDTGSYKASCIGETEVLVVAVIRKIFASIGR